MNSGSMGRFKLKGVVYASFTVVVFFSVFTNSLTAASNPLQDEICKEVFCGEGRCQGTNQFPFMECICNPDWTNFNNFTAFPCLLPNCTIHSQCGNASSPALAPPFRLPNISDPCSISFCGADGSCVSNGSNFKCQCSHGSFNLLNNPKFPCFHKCNLGEDCNGVNLGFNEALPPFAPPAPLENSISATDEGSLLCGIAFCGEGRCEDAVEFPFVKCICDEGWINFNNDPHLPCVLPNCTFDFHCGNGGPSPPPPPPPPPFQLPNISDPCWIDICGPVGKCESQGSDRKCQCDDGSANLLGDPKLPCFKKCYLGAGCPGLGLGFNQPPPAPPPPTNSVPPTNGDMLNGLGKLYMLSVIVSAALVLSI